MSSRRGLKILDLWLIACVRVRQLAAAQRLGCRRRQDCVTAAATGDSRFRFFISATFVAFSTFSTAGNNATSQTQRQLNKNVYASIVKKVNDKRECFVAIISILIKYPTNSWLCDRWIIDKLQVPSIKTRPKSTQRRVRKIESKSKETLAKCANKKKFAKRQIKKRKWSLK